MGDTTKPGGTGRQWSFGAAAFDERAMRLFVAGRAVDLELKPLELLRFLLQRPGVAVSKDDVVKAVWPGRTISDSALTSTIAKLREALGPEADAIRTVHGFGYRLDAEVRGSDGGREVEGVATRATRRLTAIMFTDLVGFSELAHRDEPLALELLELHRGWVREILPRHGGREIETIGDAFLVEFAGALAAVECAVAIQERFDAHNAVAPEHRRMWLRIGIHAGDVQHKDGKVMGDGVNIASRIHGRAEPGGICVSEDVQRAVRPHGYRLESLGTPALKNIATPLELFRVKFDGAPGPATKRQWMGVPPRGLAAVAAVVAAIGLAVAGYVGRAPEGEAPPASVAVLPFTSMSADEENAYFTDGMHDTILTHLSRMRALKVISRTSVMRFREGERDIGEIAKALGVDHVVEGSVQRSGNRLRITVQLIEAKSDRHMWAENYDRDLADIFAVQSDVAQRIAEGLRARLAPEEVARIERVPSHNPEAYDLYLRALMVGRRSFLAEEEEVREAIGWLERAVVLDPSFAQAHALLAEMYDALYWYFGRHTEANRDRIAKSADTALALDGGLADAHVARALFEYHGRHDYGAAIAALEQARALEPGNAKPHYWLTNVYRRQGRWGEGLASSERAVSLDPLNGALLRAHASILGGWRRYADARVVLGRLALVEKDAFAEETSAYMAFLETGDLAAVRRAHAAAPATDAACTGSSARLRIALFSRQFDAAEAAIESCPIAIGIFGGDNAPKAFAKAYVRWLAGGRSDASLVAEARSRLEEWRAERPDLPDVGPMLAFTLVMRGDRPGALAQVERALADEPMSRDAMEGAIALRIAAEVHANAGATDRAIEELRQLLRIPLFVHPWELKLHPGWDPLRGDPRFERLLAEHMGRAVVPD